MPRPSKPWFRKSRNAWVSKIDGKLVTLAHGKGNFKKAVRRLHELKAASRPPGQNVLLGELAVVYLKDIRRRQEEGLLGVRRHRDILRRLKKLLDELGDREAASLRPTDVTTHLARRGVLSPATRAGIATEIKGVLTWGVREGLLDKNPLAGLRVSGQGTRRERVLDPEVVPEILGAVESVALRDLILFLWLTGARPGEAASTRAQDVDWPQAVVRLAKHKTVKTTGRPRVIPLPWPLLLRLRVLAEMRPEGPLLLSPRGRPWTDRTIGACLQRLRVKAGVGPELHAYAFRHLYATTLLERTGDLATTAAALGHAGVSLLGRVYSHLEHRTAHLVGTANAIVPARPDPPASPKTSGEAGSSGE